MKKFKISNWKTHIFQLLLISLFLIPFFAILYKIFSVRALSFGCFDDCANYMAGYFMLSGKRLYSEIFYNHIMGMAYVSFFIQKIHFSINIYDLVLTHRKVIIILAFLFDVYIIKRFGRVGLLFVIFYELTKFYVFGDRFLAESLVVYALVILSGLLFEKIRGKKLSSLEYCISGFLTFFVIVMREPYIPLSIFLFMLLFYGRNFNKKKILLLVSFLTPLCIVLANTDLSAFYFNDFTVNSGTAIKGELVGNNTFGVGFFMIFLYPFFLFFYGKWNIFHYFLMSLSVAFLTGTIFLTKNRKLKIIVILFLILGLANIRVTTPGTTFYEAYHMMVWYGIFIFMAFYGLFTYLQQYKKVVMSVLGLCTLSLCILLFNPKSYLYDKINLQDQLLTNFGKEMNVGTVIHDLSRPSDTLFLDGGDDLIYWQAKLYSPYKYSWYTSIMPLITQYKNARTDMFQNNSPDFYYDFCSKTAPQNSSLPGFIKNNYMQLNQNGKKSCLYVKKENVKKITVQQWEKAKQGFFELPSSQL